MKIVGQLGLFPKFHIRHGFNQLGSVVRIGVGTAEVEAVL